MLALARLGIALALPWALATHGRLGLGLVLVAALSDYVDGPLARRGPPTRYGALLDNLADIALVLGAAGTGARLGLVSWLAPAAIATAFATYAIASMLPDGWRPARTRLGHTAGVLNYALAITIAVAAALPTRDWSPWLATASTLVIAVNGAAVLTRLRRRSN